MTLEATPYQQLAAALNEQVELLYHAKIMLVEQPGVSFPWFYENANQVFNDATYAYLSARVCPGSVPGLLRLVPGDFPNAYLELLNQIVYEIGFADLATHLPRITEQARHGNALLGRLRRATSEPSPATSGMHTVDPETGAISLGYQVGYRVQPPLVAIDRTIYGGKPEITVRVPAGSGLTATLTYTGVQMISPQPAMWRDATGTGWFYPDPIAQAFRRGQRDVTGYRFVTQPAYDPRTIASGGNVGWLAGLLISNPPEIAFSVPAFGDAAMIASANTIAAFFDALQAIGLAAPRGAQAPELAPTDGWPTVPLLCQQAYVIGAVVDVFIG